MKTFAEMMELYLAEHPNDSLANKTAGRDLAARMDKAEAATKARKAAKP